jgi:hypothetical protein
MAFLYYLIIKIDTLKTHTIYTRRQSIAIVTRFDVQMATAATINIWELQLRTPGR